MRRRYRRCHHPSDESRSWRPGGRGGGHGHGGPRRTPAPAALRGSRLRQAGRAPPRAARELQVPRSQTSMATTRPTSRRGTCPTPSTTPASGPAATTTSPRLPATASRKTGLCRRKDSRALTADEQTRFLNAFSQINTLGALGPMVDIHGNAVHQMHGNPRFLPWHRIYLVKMEQLLMIDRPDGMSAVLALERRAGLSLVAARVLARRSCWGPGPTRSPATPAPLRRCRTPRR